MPETMLPLDLSLQVDNEILLQDIVEPIEFDYE
jgi:hypothetical protein